MSYVTNVMVSAPCENKTAIAELTREGAWKASDSQRLLSLTDGDAAGHWGGSKWPECDIYAAAFNYIDMGAFMSWLLAIPWSSPGDVQLFVQGEEDECFSIYEIVTSENGERAWHKYARPSRAVTRWPVKP